MSLKSLLIKIPSKSSTLFPFFLPLVVLLSSRPESGVSSSVQSSSRLLLRLSVREEDER